MENPGPEATGTLRREQAATPAFQQPAAVPDIPTACCLATGASCSAGLREQEERRGKAFASRAPALQRSRLMWQGVEVVRPAAPGHFCPHGLWHTGTGAARLLPQELCEEMEGNEGSLNVVLEAHCAVGGRGGSCLGREESCPCSTRRQPLSLCWAMCLHMRGGCPRGGCCRLFRGSIPRLL